MNQVLGYKIAYFVGKPDIDKNMKSKGVYLVASHHELNSCNFYKGLADIQPVGEVKDMMWTASGGMRHNEKGYTCKQMPLSQKPMKDKDFHSSLFMI